MLAPESDTGVLGDNGTSLAQATLEGLTEAGALVELFRSDDPGALLASAIADGAGSYRFSGIALVLGENAFTARSTDAAGNAATAELVVQLDDVLLAFTDVTGDAAIQRSMSGFAPRLALSPVAKAADGR